VKGVLPHFACSNAAIDLFHDAIDVIRALLPRPAPLLRLIERQSREVEPALVVPVDVAGLVGHPSEGGDVVGQCAEAGFALTLGALGIHPSRCVDDDGENADGGSRRVAHRAEVEIGPHIFRLDAALQNEVLVAEREWFTCKPRLQHAAIEVGSLGPSLQHRHSEQLGVACAREGGVSVVVKHDPTRPPQQHHRHR
jgi:hypothetical protein